MHKKPNNVVITGIYVRNNYKNSYLKKIIKFYIYLFKIIKTIFNTFLADYL